MARTSDDELRQHSQGTAHHFKSLPALFRAFRLRSQRQSSALLNCVQVLPAGLHPQGLCAVSKLLQHPQLPLPNVPRGGVARGLLSIQAEQLLQKGLRFLRLHRRLRGKPPCEARVQHPSKRWRR
eukprot:scaffold8584_cov305-Pinguiococcus_pyrenoidosus.AAC.1